MSPVPRLPARTAAAFAGATAVAAAELAALALSVRLSTAAVHDAVPASVSSLPVVTVTVAAAGVAVAVRRRADDGAPFVVSGVALIVAAPVTAFGGGCGFAGDGVAVFRSGVRIGIGFGDCVTFLNGALLVLGYALLSAGLWRVTGGLSTPNLGRLGLPKRQD